LMILDITMLDMSGLDVLEEVKGEFPDAAIIMCSAMGQQSFVVDAIKLGAHDFLVKPVKEERLIASVRNALSLSRFRKE